MNEYRGWIWDIDHNITAMIPMCIVWQRRSKKFVLLEPRTISCAHSYLYWYGAHTDSESVSEWKRLPSSFAIDSNSTHRFLIFIHFTHIVPSLYVSVVRHSHSVRFRSAEVCCNSKIRNAIFVCCGISCMCCCVQWKNVFFSFHFDLALFLFRSARLGRAFIVCVCVRACLRAQRSR